MPIDDYWAMNDPGHSADHVNARAWRRGGPPGEPAGFGLKLAAIDGDTHFNEAWVVVSLGLENDGSTVNR
jgi:hypothetical protein